MNKHFVTAFVAVSTLLASASHGAFAGSHSRATEPSIPDTAIPDTAIPDTAIPDTAIPDTAAWVGESGTASYYSSAYHGRRAASGVRFDQKLLTAAHAWLPFGTKIRVALVGTGRSVIVTITDRLHSNRRVVDLSLAAARELGMVRRGVAEVTIVPA